jgi:hypothetical protein
MRRGKCGMQGDRCRAKREQPETFEGLLPENRGQNLALTVLHVPYSRDSDSEDASSVLRPFGTPRASSDRGKGS